MNEVSGRFAKWVFESGLADGATEAQLLQGVAIPAEVLRGGRNRIAWDDYVLMLENYHRVVGTEGMRRSALEFGTSQELKFFSKIAGLFLSPKNLYRFMYRWAGNHFLRNVNFEFGINPDRTFQITSTIDGASRGSEVYFITLSSVLAGAPCRIGRPPAEVTIVDQGSHRAKYRIEPPRSASIGWYLKWPLRALASIPAFASLFARQQAEIKLSHSAITRQQEDFRAMVDQISDCLLILDDDGRTLFANAAVRNRFGLSEGSPGGWDPATALDREAQQVWREFLASGSEGEREFCFRTPGSNGVGTLWLSFVPPKDTMFGETEARMVVGRDVTETRQVEARLRQGAYEERRRIAGDLHDGLGQVLTGINWQANLLANKLDESAGPEIASAARTIAELATDATRQARDLAHGLAGIDENPDNLRRALVQHARKVEREFKLEVDLDLPPEDKPLSAPGQAAVEVLRIIQEATHNAMKHADAGRLHIAMEINPERWTVRVTDDGRGLGADAASANTGIGVRSMQYRAVGLGGNIDLRARDDGTSGTVLVLSIPALSLAAAPPAAGRERSAEPSAARPSEKRRVMVADDHEIVREGIVAMLSNEPDLEVCCQTGKRDEIVPLAVAELPDVLVLDMLMDGDDNLEIIRELSAELPALRIAVLSMFDEEHYGEAARNAGAAAYVMKQSPPAELVAQVRQV